MIKSNHHPVIYPLVKYYTSYILRKNFDRLVHSGSYIAGSRPVLIVANHVSWWDGFWILHFNNLILRKKMHFMMLERELKKYPFFAHSGGFSVDKGSGKILESIAYATELLTDGKNSVLIFPQGRIESLYNDRFVFEKGIVRIAEKLYPQIDILFVANTIDYLSNKKPTLYTRYKEYKPTSFAKTTWEEDYNLFYKEVLSEIKENRHQ